jgi:NNP family nitrate/nitrite transporter-like MFS transporter
MIGEIGALGGAILPNAMGLSKTYTGSFAVGFVLYSILAALVLITLQFAQRKWVGRWVGKGGKPLEVPSVLTTEGATAAGMASA